MVNEFFHDLWCWWTNKSCTRQTRSHFPTCSSSQEFRHAKSLSVYLRPLLPPPSYIFWVTRRSPSEPPTHPRSAAARLHILCSGVCILCSGVCKPMSRHANLYSDHRAAARYGLHVKCALGLSEQRPLPTFACLMSERSDVDVSPTYTSTPPPPGPSTLFTKVLAENLLCWDARVLL